VCVFAVLLLAFYTLQPAAGFYSGPVAEAIVAAVQSRGGVMALDDLAAHSTAAVEPISTQYK
jgi:gamma-glutamyltranspeptidase/glutathione hydrolase